MPQRGRWSLVHFLGFDFFLGETEGTVHLFWYLTGVFMFCLGETEGTVIVFWRESQLPQEWAWSFACDYQVVSWDVVSSTARSQKGLQIFDTCKTVCWLHTSCRPLQHDDLRQ